MVDEASDVTALEIEVGENNKSAAEIKVEKSWAEQNVDSLVLFLVIYYLAWMFFSFWFLLDIWSENFVLLRAVGVPDDILDDLLIRTIGFTFAGGFLGSVIYHIRMMFYFHTRKDFGVRWFGKYLTAPLEGAGLALIVLALIRGGIAMLGAVPGDQETTAANFAAFGVAALVGFSTRDVVAWLGRIVRSIFVTESPSSG